MDPDEKVFLFWLVVGVSIITAILLYRLVNHIIWKVRLRRSLKRMKRSIARATEAFNQVMMSTANLTDATKRWTEIVMTSFAGEVGFEVGRWVKKNVPQIIKEVHKNERTRKTRDSQASETESKKS